MLEKDDFSVLQKMLDDAFRRNNKELRFEFKEVLEQKNIDLKRDLRDKMRSLILASEKQVIHTITEFIDSNIVIQIDELQTDMIIVKNHLKLA